MTPLTQQLIQRTAPMMVGMRPDVPFLCVISPRLKRKVLITVGEFVQGHWIQLLDGPAQQQTLVKSP